MTQIVSATINEDGNYVIEVKPLPPNQCRASASGENVHVGGTIGWAESLGLSAKDPDGKLVPLLATVDIRYRNPHFIRGPKSDKTLTSDDLKQAARKGQGKKK